MLMPNSRMPEPFTESLSHEDKAKQALPEAEISEERAMLALTKGGCESVPRLLNWKRVKQDNLGPIPGGYLIYLVLQNLPGVRLSREDYWNLSEAQREEIREAFKVAYMCVPLVIQAAHLAYLCSQCFDC